MRNRRKFAIKVISALNKPQRERQKTHNKVAIGILRNMRGILNKIEKKSDT